MIPDNAVVGHGGDSAFLFEGPGRWFRLISISKYHAPCSVLISPRVSPFPYTSDSLLAITYSFSVRCALISQKDTVLRVFFVRFITTAL